MTFPEAGAVEDEELNHDQVHTESLMLSEFFVLGILASSTVMPLSVKPETDVLRLQQHTARG